MPSFSLKAKRQTLVGYPLALVTFICLYRWPWRTSVHPSHSAEPDIFGESSKPDSLSQYLDTMFDRSQTIFVTLVDGNYASASHNFENKLRELNLDHPVINICADQACLKYTRDRGLNGYGGYVLAASTISTSMQGFENQEHIARVGKFPRIKFHALRELANAGWTSIWFEGDIYLVDDPFPHMLNISQPWDIQFTFDGWTLVNFGWVYMRPTPASVQFWADLYEKHLENEQEWDQMSIHYALSNAYLSGNEETGQTLTKNELRVFVLPWRKFWGQHLTGGNRHLAASDKPVMHHLTAIWGPLRAFVAKERGWFTDVDSYYSQAPQRKLLTTPYLSGSLTEVTQAMVILLSIAKLSGRTVLLPERIFIYGIERTMSEVFPIGALLPHIELLEGKYWKHAERYLPDIEDLRRRTTRRIPLVVHRTIEKLLTAVLDRSDDMILSLEGWQLSSYSQWDIQSTFSNTEAEMFLDLPVCRSWYQEMDFKYRYYCSPKDDHFI